MVTRFPGQLLRASDVEVLWVVKETDESLTSNTTLQNDDTLLLPVAANTRYEIGAMVGYLGNTTGDFKMGFTFPTGAAIYWTGKGAPIALDSSFGETSGTALSYAGQTTLSTVAVSGLLDVGSTAGTLQLQWAQNTSNATATVVKAGSFIRASARE